MKRWSFCLLALLPLLCLCISCTTTKTETEYVTEYVPVEVDISDIVEPVIAMRPDNSELDINTSNILTVLDVTMNSIQYQKAWEMWQTYAEMLENVIIQIEDALGPKEETV